MHTAWLVFRYSQRQKEEDDAKISEILTPKVFEPISGIILHWDGNGSTFGDRHSIHPEIGFLNSDVSKKKTYN